jgi:hypothetical protein
MNTRSVVLSLLLGLLALGGCGIGDAPKGLTPEETRAAVAKLPPDKQIDYINRSPLPAEEKQKRIAAIKTANGLK